MSDVVDFRTLISTPLDQFEAMPLLPEGYYYGEIIRVQTDGKSKNKGTPFFCFYHHLLEPAEDIVADPAKMEIIKNVNLRDYGEFPRIFNNNPPTGEGVFYITKAAMPRVREFVESFGHQGMDLSTFVQTHAVKSRVLVQVAHRTPEATERNRNPRQFAEIVAISGLP